MLSPWLTIMWGISMLSPGLQSCEFPSAMKMWGNSMLSSQLRIMCTSLSNELSGPTIDLLLDDNLVVGLEAEGRAGSHSTLLHSPRYISGIRSPSIPHPG